MATAVAKKIDTNPVTKEASTEASTIELMLSKGTNALVDRTREHYAVVDGQATLPENFYQTMLPSDIAAKYLKDESVESLYEVKQALDKFDTQLTAATALVHGEAYLEEVKAKPELSDWTLRFKSNTATVTHRVMHDRDARSPSGAVTKKFAVVQTSVKVQAAKGSSGDLSRVRKHLNVLGAQLLS